MCRWCVWVQRKPESGRSKCFSEHHPHTLPHCYDQFKMWLNYRPPWDHHHGVCNTLEPPLSGAAAFSFQLQWGTRQHCVTFRLVPTASEVLSGAKGEVESRLCALLCVAMKDSIEKHEQLVMLEKHTLINHHLLMSVECCSYVLCR